MKLASELLLAAALVLPLTALASPPTEASIEELLRLNKSGEMLDASHEQMEPMIKDLLADMTVNEKLSPEQQAFMDTFAKRYAKILREELGWTKLKPEMVQLYREVFTQEEVHGQIAFYRTPVGQSMVAKMPLVMQKSLELSQRQMRLVIPRLQADMREALAKAKAQH